MVKFQKLRLPQRANFVSNSVKSLMLVGKWGTLVATGSFWKRFAGAESRQN